MTITLTREEAQQVLDAFLGIGQRAYDAMDGDAFHECSIAVSRLRARLSAPEPEPWQVIPDSVGTKHLTEMKAKSIIERDGRVVTGYVLDTDDSVCIVYHSAVRWYSNEEMFRVMHSNVYQPKPVALAWAEGYKAGINDERTSEANIGIAGFDAKVEPARQNPYTTPPQREWQGLTDEEKNEITWGKTVYEILDLAEAKLKEKNA